ncbi:MAG: hypothetical protein LBF68_03875 [Christensenellaceae bacterium]|jgi:hypothetical protein|nr:hypothetical protein [Christensenellaceae bacterium]
MFLISAMSFGDSVVTALFLFGTVVLVLAFLGMFFKLLSIVFAKEAEIRGACNKFTAKIKTKLSNKKTKTKVNDDLQTKDEKVNS